MTQRCCMLMLQKSSFVLNAKTGRAGIKFHGPKIIYKKRFPATIMLKSYFVGLIWHGFTTIIYDIWVCKYSYFWNQNNKETPQPIIFSSSLSMMYAERGHEGQNNYRSSRLKGSFIRPDKSNFMQVCIIIQASRIIPTTPSWSTLYP